MNRGARRSSIFRHDDHCVLFLDLVGETVDRFGVEVHAYALVPNHYHLLIRSVLGNLSRAMQYLTGEFVARLNRASRWDGPVFRGRFRDQVVDRSKHLEALLPYLHLNPVRAGLVNRPQEECWTSHRAYVGLEEPPEWLTCDVLHEAFGGPEGVRALVEAYRLKRREWPEWLGADAGWIRDADVPRAPKRVARPRGHAASRKKAPEAAMKRALSISKATRAEVETVERGPRANPARRFAVWAVDRGTTLTHREIGAHLGMSTTQVAKVLQRLRSAPAPAPIDEWIARWRVWEEDMSNGGV